MSGILKLSKFAPLVFISISATCIVAIFSLSGCSSPNKNDNPEVYNLVAPDSLIRAFPDTAYIIMSVRDPQGLENVDSVYFTTTKPDGSPGQATSYLNDNGEYGDSIAGDGDYTVGIWSSPANDTGVYVFHFTARDKDNNQGNIIDHDLRLYDYPNPVIMKLIVNQYDDSRQHLYVSAKVLDAQNRINIDSVWVNITRLEDTTFVGSFLLNDFGQMGDSTGLDNYFSRDITSGLGNDVQWAAGSYHLIFEAVDYDGNEAMPEDTLITIEPPVIN